MNPEIEQLYKQLESNNLIQVEDYSQEEFGEWLQTPGNSDVVYQQLEQNGLVKTEEYSPEEFNSWLGIEGAEQGQEQQQPTPAGQEAQVLETQEQEPEQQGVLGNERPTADQATTQFKQEIGEVLNEEHIGVNLTPRQKLIPIFAAADNEGKDLERREGQSLGDQAVQFLSNSFQATKGYFTGDTTDLESSRAAQKKESEILENKKIEIQNDYIDELPSQIGTVTLQEEIDRRLDIDSEGKDGTDSEVEIVRKSFRTLAEHTDQLTKVQDRRWELVPQAEKDLFDRVSKGEDSLPGDLKGLSPEFLRWMTTSLELEEQTSINSASIAKHQTAMKVFNDGVIKAKDEGVAGNGSMLVGIRELTDYIEDNAGNEELVQAASDVLRIIEEESKGSNATIGDFIYNGLFNRSGILNDNVSDSKGEVSVRALTDSVDGAFLAFKDIILNKWNGDATGDRAAIEATIKEVSDRTINENVRETLYNTADSRSAAAVVRNLIDIKGKGIADDVKAEVDNKGVVTRFIDHDGYTVFDPSEKMMEKAAEFTKDFYTLPDDEKKKLKEDYNYDGHDVNGHALAQQGLNVTAQMLPMFASGGSTAAVAGISAATMFGGNYKQALKETGDIDKAFGYAVVVSGLTAFVESKVGKMETKLGTLFSKAERASVDVLARQATKEAMEASIKGVIGGRAKLANSIFIKKLRAVGTDFAGELAEEFSNIPVEQATRAVFGMETESVTAEELYETFLITSIVTIPFAGAANVGGKKAKDSYFDLMVTSSGNLKKFDELAEVYINEENITETQKEERTNEIAHKRSNLVKVNDHVGFVGENSVNVDEVVHGAKIVKDQKKAERILQTALEFGDLAESSNNSNIKNKYNELAQENTDQYQEIIEESVDLKIGVPIYKIDGKKVNVDEFRSTVKNKEDKIKDGSIIISVTNDNQVLSNLAGKFGKKYQDQLDFAAKREVEIKEVQKAKKVKRTTENKEIKQEVKQASETVIGQATQEAVDTEENTNAAVSTEPLNQSDIVAPDGQNSLSTNRADSTSNTGEGGSDPSPTLKVGDTVELSPEVSPARVAATEKTKKIDADIDKAIQQRSELIQALDGKAGLINQALAGFEVDSRGGKKQTNPQFFVQKLDETGGVNAALGALQKRKGAQPISIGDLPKRIPAKDRKEIVDTFNAKKIATKQRNDLQDQKSKVNEQVQSTGQGQDNTSTTSDAKKQTKKPSTESTGSVKSSTTNDSKTKKVKTKKDATQEKDSKKDNKKTSKEGAKSEKTSKEKIAQRIVQQFKNDLKLLETLESVCNKAKKAK